MPRLFTGLELPEDIQDELDDLSQPVPGAQWVHTVNLHITLRFAGDIDKPVAREFADELSRIDMDVFELRLEGLGTFGGQDPRVLWAGVAPSPALDQLQRAHERAARSAGLPPEPRPFKAHVTLARLRNAHPEALIRVLKRKALYRSRAFIVEAFALFSSKPLTGGGPYVVEERFPLRGGFVFDAEEGSFR
jgi:RNA 2',3'-cyclic 3'-phosphodiesterase